MEYKVSLAAILYRLKDLNIISEYTYKNISINLNQKFVKKREPFNIITDLNNANILKQFVELDNVYIGDLLKHDEINNYTADTSIVDKLKVMNATNKDLAEISIVRRERPKLSTYDALNYILAKNNNCILATGDNELKKYSEKK